jgi:hypothetical protein
MECGFGLNARVDASLIAQVLTRQQVRRYNQIRPHVFPAERPLDLYTAISVPAWDIPFSGYASGLDIAKNSRQPSSFASVRIPVFRHHFPQCS